MTGLLPQKPVNQKVFKISRKENINWCIKPVDLQIFFSTLAQSAKLDFYILEFFSCFPSIDILNIPMAVLLELDTQAQVSLKHWI